MEVACLGKIYNGSALLWANYTMEDPHPGKTCYGSDSEELSVAGRVTALWYEEPPKIMYSVPLSLFVAACLAGMPVGANDADKTIIVEGFNHWFSSYNPAKDRLSDGARSPDLNSPRVFGPNGTVWSLDCYESRHVILVAISAQGQLSLTELSYGRLRQLGIPTNGRGSDTRDPYSDFQGRVVGFDKGVPIVAWDAKLLRYSACNWSRYKAPGWDVFGEFLEVRPDATVVMKEYSGHTFAVTTTSSGLITRYDLGPGTLSRAVGMGSDSLLVSVKDGKVGNPPMRVWSIRGGDAHLITTCKAAEIVLASDGQIYKEWHGGIDLTVFKPDFAGWTKLQPIDASGNRDIVNVAGDVYAADIDQAAHKLWGVRIEQGHMGEPFIEANFQTNKQREITTNTVGAVGRYERTAYIPSRY